MNTENKIKRVLEKIVELRKVEKHFQATMNQLDESYKQLEEYQNILEKEYKDVKELEGLSMKSLFHKVLGSKEQQIEKERQEYLQASLRYNEFKKSVELLEFERDLLKNKITDITVYQNKLENLKKIREKELLMSNTDQGKELMRVVHHLDELVRKKKELKEALKAGNDSSAILKKLISHLRKAKDWGSWDMMSSRGGRHSGYYKRGAIDTARETSYDAKHALNRFQKELLDIGERHYNFNVDIGNFNTFMDIFFDNLISDWVVQQKIKNALNNVLGTHDKVIRLIQSIEHKTTSLEEEVKKYEDTKDQIILKIN